MLNRTNGLSLLDYACPYMTCRTLGHSSADIELVNTNI
jgi:hypothetical protein